MKSNLLALYKRCLDAHYTHVEDNSGDYAIEREGNTLYILFQWSSGKVDWKNNFDFPAKPYKDMEISWSCHRGFLRVWKSIEPYLEEAVNDMTVSQIYVVGYSHGAAIATLCHEYVWYHRPDLRENGLEGFGFGCPKVYFGFMKAKLKERWKHFHPVRNCSDIVTYVPPVLFGYVHVNTVYQLKNKKLKYRHGKNLKCIDSHYEDNYIYSLEQEEESSDI